MRKVKFVLIFLIQFLFTPAIFAQCIDSLSISPGFTCPDPSYKPVCGCDGKTYRNDCDAKYKNGVQNWTDGPCSGMEFDIIPTYLGPNDYLLFSFSQNRGVSATLYIFDYFGKIIQQQILPSMDNFNPPNYQIYFDVSTYRPGVYIISITNSKGDYRFKKFVKY